MRRLPSISQEHELFVGKPVQQRRHQPLGQLDRGFVPASFLLVDLLRTVQRREYRQRPGSAAKGKSDDDGQRGPTMSPTGRRVGIGGPDRVVMAPLP